MNKSINRYEYNLLTLEVQNEEKKFNNHNNPVYAIFWYFLSSS